ncbi:MAG TPA: hypothetical protein PK708_07660 [Candidatus Competibacter sp.]|nr:hypothetical protein [Candidatus Competibacter sp.]
MPTVSSAMANAVSVRPALIKLMNMQDYDSDKNMTIETLNSVLPFSFRSALFSCRSVLENPERYVVEVIRCPFLSPQIGDTQRYPDQIFRLSGFYP